MEDVLLGYQNGFKHLSKLKLTGETLRVLLYVFSTVGTDFNRVSVSQVKIAEELGLNRQNVNRSFKVLLDEGILFEDVAIVGRKIYKVNSEYIFRPPVIKL